MLDSQFIMKKRKLFQLCSILVLTSCSTSEWLINFDQRRLLKENLFFGREDRSSLLFSIQSVYDQFKETNKKALKQISKRSTHYLNGLIQKDEYNNDFKLNYSYLFLDSEEVIFFISPSGQVLFSKGLLENFVQTESILKVILSECYLRNKYGVYSYTEFPPTGFKEIRHLSMLLFVEEGSKMKLNSWVYQLLRNNSVDTNSLLDWVQAKNRSSHLAVYIAPEKRDSLKEEQQIKDYLLTKGIHNEVENLEAQSSSFFYFKREFSN